MDRANYTGVSHVTRDELAAQIQAEQDAAAAKGVDEQDILDLDAEADTLSKPAASATDEDEGSIGGIEVEATHAEEEEEEEEEDLLEAAARDANAATHRESSPWDGDCLLYTSPSPRD